MNKMQDIRIEKITLNIGAGVNQDTMKKAAKLLKNLTGREPVKTVSSKRIPGWGVRPGLPLGCKLTVRKKESYEILKRVLAAKENKLKESCFDKLGNVSFGLHEYIEVTGLNYDPAIGMLGFQVSATLSRPGYRIMKRRKRPSKQGKKHLVTKQDSIEFFKKQFGVTIE